MGLDGISINQLRLTPENNSAELNNSALFSANTSHKVVDGLSVGQKVDPDKRREHEKADASFDEDEHEEDESSSNEEVFDTIKYDLSNCDKYILKIDDKTNNILIIEKSSNAVLQKINAQELSAFVNFLSNSQGSIINRKF